MNDPPNSIPGWKRAAALSVLAIYGPFLVMAIYMSLFVACSHCKSSAWMMLPSGPGLALVDIGRRLLDTGRPSDGIWMGLSMFTSIGIAVVLSWLLRRGAWMRCLSFSLVLLGSSVFALAVYGLIRS